MCYVQFEKKEDAENLFRYHYYIAGDFDDSAVDCECDFVGDFADVIP